jgi:hypothetical protein
VARQRDSQKLECLFRQLVEVYSAKIGALEAEMVHGYATNNDDASTEDAGGNCLLLEGPNAPGVEVLYT